MSVAIRLAGLALLFLQAALAARLLGAEQYGVVSVALSVAQIAMTISVFGYGRLAIRELARLEAAGRVEAIAHFTGHTARVVAGLAVISGAAISTAALAGVVPAAYQPALVACGLAVLPLALLQLQRGIAQGLGRIAVAQAPGDVLRPGLLAAFLITVATANIALDPRAYIFAFTATAFAALALSLPFTLRAIHSTRISVSLLEDRNRWRTEAIPFFGLALTAALLGELNTLMLGWLATPHEAGLFQPIARLTPLMALPVQAAGMRFAPRIAELWERRQTAQISKLSRTFTTATLAVTSAAALSLALAGPWIMSVFGPEFEGSAKLLWVVAAAQIFNAACGPVAMLLTMRGRTGAALAGQLTGLGANALLGIWLIPNFGALGAAMAMAGGIVAWNVAMLVLLRYPRGVERHS